MVDVLAVGQLVGADVGGGLVLVVPEGELVGAVLLVEVVVPEQRIFATLPDGTWVYPGHGDDTTLGAERPSLPG